MAEDQRLGACHWIDHYAVPTNDLDRWVDWNARVLGATEPWQDTVPAPGQPRRAEFRVLGGCHVIGFAQGAPVPPGKGLGQGLPRYGFYVRAEDVPEHMRRLDELGVPHTTPTRTSAEGEAGTTIFFQDPDENQFEFWAPDRMPDGAMEGASPQGVGRISHAVFESRDLDRTASFYSRFCGLDRMGGPGIAPDTMVLPMVAGSRLVFKKVDQLQLRTGGSTKWQGVHNAFVVRDEEFYSAYERIWTELEEWDYDQRAQGPAADAAELGARTGMHGSDAGRRWKAMYGRGDQIYDWDTNSFHFVGGSSDGPRLATYEAHYMEDYVEKFMKAKEQEAAR
jgi:catechol 2,3-dioxygenase-like lactoylglutathione lyase family enzyme